MSKWKITIEKWMEESIEAETEDKALDIAWEMWSQDDEVNVFIEKETKEE